MRGRCGAPEQLTDFSHAVIAAPAAKGLTNLRRVPVSSPVVMERLVDELDDGVALPAGEAVAEWRHPAPTVIELDPNLVAVELLAGVEIWTHSTMRMNRRDRMARPAPGADEHTPALTEQLTPRWATVGAPAEHDGRRHHREPPAPGHDRRSLSV
jgi:hypothetical protein